MSTDNGLSLPEISSVQQQAISLLILGRRQSEISEQLNVAPETISRWKLQPDFLAALNFARLNHWQQTQEAINNLRETSIDALHELLQSDDDNIKLKAVKMCLVELAQAPSTVIDVEKAKLELARYQPNKMDILATRF